MQHTLSLLKHCNALKQQAFQVTTGQWHKIHAWIFQQKHKDAAIHLRDDVERAFTEHPHETGETYFQHLWFTISISARFFIVSLIITIHGIFPFLFTRTASAQIESVYRIMKSRVPKDRRDAIEREDQEFKGVDI